MATGRRRAEKHSVLPNGRLFTAIIAIVVAVVGGWLWVLSSDVETPLLPPRSKPGPATPGTTGTTGPTGAAASYQDLYAALGTKVTAEATGCVDDDTLTDEGDELVESRVRCDVPDGSLVLTTYRNDGDFEAQRAATLTTDVGTIMSARDAGAYRSFDPKLAGNRAAPASVYWDNRIALQSAELIGAKRKPLSTMARVFEGSGASVTAPTGPVDRKMQELVSIFQFRDCKRVPIRFAGQTEESECKYAGFEARAGRFADRADFEAFRGRHANGARSESGGFDDFWYHDANRNGSWEKSEKRQGNVYGLIDRTEKPVRSVLYIDDVECGCYLQLIGGPDVPPTDIYAKIF